MVEHMHMERFEDGGQYFSMVQSRAMEQYIVLDFTVMQPKKRRPGITAAKTTKMLKSSTFTLLREELNVIA